MSKLIRDLRFKEYISEIGGTCNSLHFMTLCHKMAIKMFCWLLCINRFWWIIMTTQWLKYQSCQQQTTSSNPPVACVAYMHFHPLWYLPFYSYIKRFRPVLNSPNLKFACWRQGQRSEIERGVYCHIYIMCFPIPTTPLFFNISLVLKCCWKQTI